MADPITTSTELTTAQSPSPTPAPKTTAEALYPDGGGTPAPEVKAGEPTSEPSASVEVKEPVAEIKVEEPKEGEPKEAVLLPVPSSADGYELKVPEGLQADEALLKSFRETAFKANLPPAAAQSMLDLAPQLLEAQVQSIQAAQSQAFNELTAKWEAEVNAMPEFQGERKATTLALIGKALDEFGTPEVRQAFSATGAGNNPEIVKFVLRMAEAVSEGTPTAPGTPKGQGKSFPRSIGERLYPDSPNQ